MSIYVLRVNLPVRLASELCFVGDPSTVYQLWWVGGKQKKMEETSKPGTVFHVYFGVNSSPPAGSPPSKWTNFSFTAIHFRKGSCFAVPYLLSKGPQPPHLQSSLEKSRKVSVSRRSVCGHIDRQERKEL